jgi:hypothetical protein
MAAFVTEVEGSRHWLGPDAANLSRPIPLVEIWAGLGNAQGRMARDALHRTASWLTRFSLVVS